MAKYLISLLLLISAGCLQAAAPEPASSLEEFLADLTGESSKVARCGTQAVEADIKASVRSGLATLNAPADATAAPAGPIPVVYHVIQEGSELEQGNIPDSWIHAQHQVLNDAFNLTGIDFAFRGITRSWHPRWYRRCSKKGWEKKIVKALAIDPATTLNVYICDTGQYLGWSSFPWDHDEDSKAHSVFLWTFSVPNNQYGAPYNEGDIAVHEVGHYLGLYHTFEGGCDEPGDEVFDTPAEASASFGCPVGKDTCAGGGYDPINNYMNFTDDACMDEFTAGQGNRMMDIIELFRPSL